MRLFTSILLGLALAAVGCGGRTASDPSSDTAPGADSGGGAAGGQSGGGAVSGSDGSAQSVEDDPTCDGTTWNPLAAVKLPDGVEYIELRSFGHATSSVGTPCGGATGEGIDSCKHALAALEAEGDQTSDEPIEGQKLPVIHPSTSDNGFVAIAFVTRGSTATVLTQQELIDMFEPVTSFGGAVLVASLEGHSVGCPQTGAKALPDGGYAVRVWGCGGQEAVFSANLVEITRDGDVQPYESMYVPTDIGSCTGG
jgi:hypothetical protein